MHFALYITLCISQLHICTDDVLYQIHRNVQLFNKLYIYTRCVTCLFILHRDIAELFILIMS